MHVLLIKTSSMGDVIHTLPALTDAGSAIANIRFDWVVEESFAEIPQWHPLVERVIPIALRRWRKQCFSRQTRAEFRRFRQQIHEKNYDLILDAQALMKSAVLAFLAKGVRAGLDWASARESLASLAYQRKYTVNFYQHAIHRMRSLFSAALGYPLPNTVPEYGLRERFKQDNHAENYLVFLHGTTWASKLWPEAYWAVLANLAGKSGYRIKMSGGNDQEIARAERIAQRSKVPVDLLPKVSLASMAKLLANAQGAVAVDTGFGHLAAALSLPTVSLYGPTDPEFTGALGQSQIHLQAQFPCAPCFHRTCVYREKTTQTPACFTTIPPEQVWNLLKSLGSLRINHSENQY